jgi:hypothetical protein
MDSQNLGGVSGLLDRLAAVESENERLKRDLEEAMVQLRSTKSENEMLYTEISALRLQIPQEGATQQIQPSYAPAPVQQSTPTQAYAPAQAYTPAQAHMPHQAQPQVQAPGPALTQQQPAQFPPSTQDLPFDGFTFD